ncbi:T9SS type A sorting domain-containing protein, partial [bacterium]|nr:T9SS type A sorting domain-containing protein [bacterium]
LEGQLEFSIFDVSGRLVRRMSPLAGGTRVQWDGRDDHGRLASSGVYFVRVAAAEQVQPIKIVLLR